MPKKLKLVKSLKKTTLKKTRKLKLVPTLKKCSPTRSRILARTPTVFIGFEGSFFTGSMGR